eukprot:scaffold27320_cov131-Skeletonema_marinoi.AAC.1
MLRSSYYPEKYLALSSEWNTKPTATRSASDESRSSNSINEENAPETLGSPSRKSAVDIQGSQQLSEIPQSVPPSTPPRMLFEFNLDSVECSPDRIPQQRSPPMSPTSRNTNNDDDDDVWL